MKFRWSIPLAIFVVLVAFLWVGLGRDPREVPSPLIGKPAPQFRLAKLHSPDETISTGDLKGKGGVSVVDFATRKVEANWPIPGGGSPDMGNVSADGKMLWLSGRYDNVVYAFDTASGAVQTIPVGKEPHGLTVWPQPGRYSLGHTGNMR